MLHPSRASSCSVTALWRASKLAVLLALLTVLVPLLCAAPARADVMLDVVNWNQYTYTSTQRAEPLQCLLLRHRSLNGGQLLRRRILRWAAASTA